LTTEDLVGMGLLKSAAIEWSGVYTWTFQDGQAENDVQGPTVKVYCKAAATAVGEAVRLHLIGSKDCDANAFDDVQWRLDADGLHFHHVGSNLGQSIELKAMYETKPWQKVEAWSPGLPPNGVWQYTLTVDELVKAGMLRSATPDWAGLYTFTFQDGKFMLVWLGEQGQKGECGGTYAVVDNFVRMTRTPITADCACEVDDIQWRLDKDGLHVHLLATPYGQLIEGQMMFDTKPWQKVK